MTQQAFALRRIIIIDSFWRGKVNEIAFDGHTQLEGTNGAGKTSLMRLLPLFYGMRPSEIVSKVDQAKNFADYYLPRESSLLVYEYQRPSLGSEPQVCCMVASSDGRGVQFKLIDAPYSQAMFVSESGKPFKVGEIERNYVRTHNCFVTKYLGVDKYRQVIQNLRSGRNSSEVRQWQARFAFASVPVPHIDKVVNGTIEKNLDFESVKKMLVAIAADYLARNKHGDDREQMQLNKDEIGRWLSDIQASREIHGVSEKIQRWQGQFAELEEYLIQLRHLLALCSHFQAELNDQQDQLQQEKRQQRDALKNLEQEFGQQSDGFKQLIIGHKDQIHAKQITVDRLDDQKLDYENKDAASYQLKADRKTELQQQLSDVNSLIEGYEGDTAKIAKKFDQLLGKLDLEQAKGEGAKQQAMAGIREHAAEKLSELEQSYQQQRRKLDERHGEQSLQLKDKQRELSHKKTIIEQQLAYPQLPSQIREAQQSTQAALASTQQQHNQQLRLLNDERQNGAQLERQRDSQLHKLSVEQQRLDEIVQQSAALEQQMHPLPGSLHEFLTEQPQVGEWKSSIGCLLSPELLARTDLAPQWQGEGVNNLYGVTLDTTPLLHNNPLQLNENELRERFAAMEQQRRSQQQLLEELNELLKQLNKQFKQHQQQLSQHQAQEKRLEAEIDQLSQQAERIAQQACEALKQQAQELALQQDGLSKQLNSNSKQLATLEEQTLQAQHELHNQVLEQRIVVETDRDSQLDTLSAQLEALREGVKSRRKEYKAQQKAALAKIDPDGELDKCIAEKKQLQGELQDCAVFEQKAREYQAFLSGQYAERNQLVNAIQLLQSELSENQSLLESAQRDYDSRQADYRQILKRNAQQQERNDELLSRLNRVANVCEPMGLEPEVNEQLQQYQADMIPGFVEQAHQGFSHLEKLLNKEINLFANTLRTKHGKSSLFETWTQLVAANEHFVGSETVLKYRQPISDLLESAEQLRKSTSQLVIVNANMINEFYRHLENFGRQIKSVGRQLSERVTALAKFEALADISVGTVTRLEQQEYWLPLRSFSDCFEQAREQLREGSSDIPDELIQAMRELARVLPSEGLILEHNELFDLEFVITEQGQVKRARNARQLKKVSSTGLSYLAMLSLFAGLLAMLRGQSEQPSRILLPVDELGELAAENIELLLGMFNDNAIQMLSASPSTDRQVLALYKTHYKLKDQRIYQASVPLSKLEQLLAQRDAKRAESAAASTATSTTRDHAEG